MPANREELLDWLRRGERYAFSLTHDEDEARSMAHDAFVRLTERAGGIRSLPYLLRTIRNLVFDDRRAAARRRGQMAPFEPEGVAARDPSPAERVGHRIDTQQAIDRILALLSAEERELLYLADVEEMPAREIAELTGRSRAAILGQLARLRDRIRACIPNPFEPPQQSDRKEGYIRNADSA